MPLRVPGFVLSELLVVVCIIVLLVGLLLPAIQTAKSVSRSLVCLTNLRQIGVVLVTYSADNRGGLPPMQIRAPERDDLGLPYSGKASGFIESYLEKADGWTVFICPSSNWTRPRCDALAGSNASNSAKADFYFGSSYGMNEESLLRKCCPGVNPPYPAPDPQWKFRIEPIPHPSESIYYSEVWAINSVGAYSSNSGCAWPRNSVPMSGEFRAADPGSGYASLRVSHRNLANALFFDFSVRAIDWRTTCVPLPAAYAKPDQWLADY